jgi:hypothetical protein
MPGWARNTSKIAQPIHVPWLLLFVVLEMERRALHLLGRGSAIEPHPESISAFHTVQAGMDGMIPLPPPPRDWDFRCTPPP